MHAKKQTGFMITILDNFWYTRFKPCHFKYVCNKKKVIIFGNHKKSLTRLHIKLPPKHQTNILYHMQSPLKFGFTNKRGPTYFPWDRCKLGQPSKGAGSLPDSRNEWKYYTTHKEEIVWLSGKLPTRSRSRLGGLLQQLGWGSESKGSEIIISK